MKGTIRTLAGLLIAYAAGASFEQATDVQLIPLFFIAVVGVSMMYSGVRALNKSGC